MARSGSRFVIVAALVLCLFGIVQLSQRFTGDESAEPGTTPTPAATSTTRLSAEEQARAEAEQQERLVERFESRLGSTRPEDVDLGTPVEPGSVRLIIMIRDDMPLDIYTPQQTDSVGRCVTSPRDASAWVEVAVPGSEETVSTTLPDRAVGSPEGACEAQVVMEVPAHPAYDVRVALEGPDGEDQPDLIGPRRIGVTGDTSKVPLVG